MKKKTTWHKATEIKFRTPKEAKEKNTFSAIDIQRGREMTPAEVKAMKENPINEEHVCSDIFDKNLNCLIQTFYAGTPEGKRDLLRHGLFNQIMESKEISDLAKLAAGLFSRGMWFKTWFENNHKSIDYNFLYCFSDWCVKIGVIKTLVINNLPLTAGMKAAGEPEWIDLSRCRLPRRRRR